MTKLFRALAVGVIVSIALFPAGIASVFQGQSQTRSKTPEFAPDRVLVKFKPGRVKALGLSPMKRLALPGVQVYAVPDGQSAKSLVRKLSQDPAVEYAELDYKVSACIIPNDPRFSSLWGLRNTGQSGGKPGADIDAPAAWNLTTGSGSVVVAVIDTGVDYTHPDLAANIWTNLGEIADNGLDDDNDGYVDDRHGINARTGSGNPMDDHGHGTHCAGTIGALGNNGLGVVGVNWTVKIMPLKFLDASGNGLTSDAIECIQYAIVHGARVLSNSWGGGPFSQALQDAISAAESAGILFAAAAGNYQENNDVNPFYPSSYDVDNIISVAATDNRDALASFSNYGFNSVDVAAPGVNIISTKPGNAYQSMSGTSMATPYVAGLAALLQAFNPAWTWQDVKAGILAGVDPVAALRGKVLTGGRINALNGLTTAGDAPYIYSLNPFAGGEGNALEVNGVHFGAAQGAGSVEFGGNLSASVSSWLDGKIDCTVPSGAKSGPVIVYSSSGLDSNGFYFQVLPKCYEVSMVTNEYQGAGTAMGWQADERVWSYRLPFKFPFYGKNYPAGALLYISSNGFIDFADHGPDYINTQEGLASQTRIAPLWLDLTTAGSAQSGEDVYISAFADHLVIRWCGETLSDEAPVNFEVVLSNDGRITFNYGPGNNPVHSSGSLGPTVGISGGPSSGGPTYLSAYNTVTNLTNVATELYTRLTPALTITSPLSGTDWSRGSTRTIEWTTVGSQNASVKLQLYRGNTKVKDISFKAANDGLYDWLLPNSLAAASNYRIKLNTVDNLVSTWSGLFTISLPTLAVTAPAAEAAWTRGSTPTITWTKTGTQNASVKVQLFRGTTKVLDIAGSTPNDGSLPWLIPVTLAAGSNYRVKVKTADGLVSGFSGYFVIN
jgi:subtilisin family serine protease